MRTEKDVEAYLLRLNRRFSTVDGAPGTFLVSAMTPRMPQVAIRVDPPIIVMRVNIGKAVPAENVALFRKLLELNAKSLVHSNYGLENDEIVLSSALELENLDFNELEATLDEMDLALSQHVPILAGLNKAEGA